MVGFLNLGKFRYAASHDYNFHDFLKEDLCLFLTLLLHGFVQSPAPSSCFGSRWGISSCSALTCSHDLTGLWCPLWLSFCQAEVLGVLSHSCVKSIPYGYQVCFCKLAPSSCMPWAIGNLLQVELNLADRPPLGFGPAVSNPYNYILAKDKRI